ncbi:MAG: hypothetical protein QN157_06005 [Armatimonadota bacterium]|nr:hypothetical protein [Armatimonadota bacterium]
MDDLRLRSGVAARPTRRAFLQRSAVAPVLGALAGAIWQVTGGRLGALAQPVALQPTPPCPDADDVTPPQTAGPFYKPSSPRRSSLLEPGVTGTRLVLSGRVVTTACRPVAGALLDFWQADDSGRYDNAGFRLRGHQIADEAGRYRLETIVPGAYAGRTRHIHVRVAAPDGPVLTTQLYFPDEPRNQTDFLFDRRLVMRVRDASGGKVATFDFVLDARR